MSQKTASQGTWRQVAAIVDGKDVPIRWTTLLNVNSWGYTITVNGRVYQKGTSQTDHEKSPHETDVSVTEGTLAGKTLLQIFKVEGDVLIACIAAPGAPRPAQFASDPGSGQTLSVWLRAKEEASAPATPVTMNLVLTIAACILGAIAVGATQNTLRQDVGYWPGVLAGFLSGALALMSVALILRWGFQAGITFGVSLSIAFNTFEELRKTLEPTLGAFGALVVSASTAFVAGFITGGILTWLLKLRK